MTLLLCLSVPQVLCINTGLTAPPRRLPSSVQHLSLAGNRIRRLRTSAFRHLPHLRTLILDGNRIRRLAPFAFLGLLSLERLSLHQNPLTELTPFSLSGLRNVTYIYLGHSGVRRVRSGAFSTSAELRLLSLRGNPGATLETDAFTGLHSVDHLLLPERLRRLETGAFSGLQDVGAIVLRQPQLENLPKGALSGLRRVGHLRVDGGELGRMDPEWMAGAGAIGLLSITNVTIDELGGLNVSNSVSRFELRGSRVLGVSRRVTISLARADDVARLTLVDNLLPCTCQLYRLTSALHGAGYNVTRFSEANLCLTPQSQQQRRISEAVLPLRSVCAARDRAEEEQRKSEEVRLRAVSPASRCCPLLTLLPLVLVTVMASTLRGL